MASGRKGQWRRKVIVGSVEGEEVQGGIRVKPGFLNLSSVPEGHKRFFLQFHKLLGHHTV